MESEAQRPKSDADRDTLARAGALSRESTALLARAKLAMKEGDAPSGIRCFKDAHALALRAADLAAVNESVHDVLKGRAERIGRLVREAES